MTLLDLTASAIRMTVGLGVDAFGAIVMNRDSDDNSVGFIENNNRKGNESTGDDDTSTTKSASGDGDSTDGQSIEAILLTKENEGEEGRKDYKQRLNASDDDDSKILIAKEEELALFDEIDIMLNASTIIYPIVEVRNIARKRLEKLKLREGLTSSLSVDNGDLLPPPLTDDDLRFLNEERVRSKRLEKEILKLITVIKKDERKRIEDEEEKSSRSKEGKNENDDEVRTVETSSLFSSFTNNDEEKQINKNKIHKDLESDHREKESSDDLVSRLSLTATTVRSSCSSKKDGGEKSTNSSDKEEDKLATSSTLSQSDIPNKALNDQIPRNLSFTKSQETSPNFSCIKRNNEELYEQILRVATRGKRENNNEEKVENEEEDDDKDEVEDEEEKDDSSIEEECELHADDDKSNNELPLQLSSDTKKNANLMEKIQPNEGEGSAMQSRADASNLSLKTASFQSITEEVNNEERSLQSKEEDIKIEDDVEEETSHQLMSDEETSLESNDEDRDDEGSVFDGSDSSDTESDTPELSGEEEDSVEVFESARESESEYEEGSESEEESESESEEESESESEEESESESEEESESDSDSDSEDGSKFDKEVKSVQKIAEEEFPKKFSLPTSYTQISSEKDLRGEKALPTNGEDCDADDEEKVSDQIQGSLPLRTANTDTKKVVTSRIEEDDDEEITKQSIDDVDEVGDDEEKDDESVPRRLSLPTRTGLNSGENDCDEEISLLQMNDEAKVENVEEGGKKESISPFSQDIITPGIQNLGAAILRQLPPVKPPKLLAIKRDNEDLYNQIQRRLSLVGTPKMILAETLANTTNIIGRNNDEGEALPIVTKDDNDDNVSENDVDDDNNEERSPQEVKNVIDHHRDVDDLRSTSTIGTREEILPWRKEQEEKYNKLLLEELQRKYVQSQYSLENKVLPQLDLSVSDVDVLGHELDLLTLPKSYADIKYDFAANHDSLHSCLELLGGDVFNRSALDSLLKRDEDDDKRKKEKANTTNRKKKKRNSKHHTPSSILYHVDDAGNDKESVYGIIINEKLKIIIVVFRGSVTTKDWMEDIQVGLTPFTIPSSSTISSSTKLEKKGDNPADDDDTTNDGNIHGNVHKGFYQYLFGKQNQQYQKKDTDIKTHSCKAEKIMEQLYKLYNQRRYQDFKLYFTGHSLGGALCTLMGFRASLDDNFPSPIRIISFASPYVGDQEFRNAFERQERQRRLVHLRITNEDDVVPLLPIFANNRLLPYPSYKHVGMNMKLYWTTTWFRSKTYRFMYPKPDDVLNEVERAIGNNFLLGLSFESLKHHLCPEYRSRLDLSQLRKKEGRENLHLSDLYNNPNIVGKLFM